MMKVTVEKSFDIPEEAGRRGRPLEGPKFPQMGVGDSVFFQGERLDGPVRAKAKRHGKRYGQKFACRSVDGGIRIWRIS